MMPIWSHLVAAAILNIGTIHCLKASQSMTRAWPTIGVIVSILAVQWLMARSMDLGAEVATTTIVVVVSVIIGSVIIGYVAGDRPHGWQITGYVLAASGVLVATLSPTPARF
jgi:multidrug transporter EmrE-like cation transporter